MTSDPSRFLKVEEIFDRVVQLPRAQWVPALDELCADDPALRREVESLLDHAGAQALDLTQAIRGLIPESEPETNIGRKTGPYELRQRVGAGGMGVVYLAVQSEPVQRSVALKLLRRGLDTEDMLRRFNHERQVLAALNHPNIARLLDAGSTDDGAPFFVMEYVEGEPITTWCDRHRLDILGRLRLFQQVCAAVHFAHQNTVIHRDLKPANILITADGVPKLLDFGLAKLTAPEAQADLTCTRLEHRYLTPAYASPEQVHGHPVTTVSDVYSLGIILYELLAGCRPYGDAGQTTIDLARQPLRPSQSLRLVASGVPAGRSANHLHGSAVSPSSPAQALNAIAESRGLTLDQLRRRLKGDLDNIALTAIATEPGRRYASAEQLSADIARHLNNEPVVAVPPSAIYRLRKFARRNRAACALITAILVGAVGSTWSAVHAVRSRNAALTAEHNARIAELSARQHAEKFRRASYSKDLALAALDRERSLPGSMKRRLLETPTELRDWEWYYLNSISDDSLQTWRGHQAEVRCVAFSPDGQWVASGDGAGEIRLWNARTGATLRAIRGHNGPVSSLSFSSDGHLLATGGSDGRLKVWDPASGVESASFSANAGAVLSVRFRPRSSSIAVGYDDHNIRLWDTQTRAVLRVLAGFNGPFDSLAFSPDGRLISGAGTEGPACLWDAEEGKAAQRLGEPPGAARSTAFSPDGKCLATAILNGPVQLWDITSTPRLRQRLLRGRTPTTCGVAFSPDGQRLASTARDERVLRTWETRRVDLFRDSRGHDDRILAIAFGPDGNSIVTGSADRRLKLWDAGAIHTRAVRHDHKAAITCMAFSPDGRILASCDENEILRFWEPVPRTWILKIHLPAARPRCLAFTADGRSFAIGGADGNIQVRSAFTSQLTRAFPAHSGGVNALAASPNSRMLASGGEDGLLRLWNPDTGERVGSLRGNQAPVRSIAFSPDGSRIGSAGADGQLHVWDVKQGTELRTLSDHKGSIHSVAFSRDGRWIASAGDDETLRVWDAATGELAYVIRDLRTAVLTACFTPSGRRLFAGCADGTVSLWDIETGTQMLAFHDHGSPVTCLALSPDARIMASGGADRAVAIKDTIPFADQIQFVRNESACTIEAVGLVEKSYARYRDWEEVARVLNDATACFTPLNRRILNEILKRAAGGLLPVTDWDVRFFTWKPTSDFDELEQRWARAAANPPVHRSADALWFDWKYHPPAIGIPVQPFGMTATATYQSPAGRYRLDCASSGGLRVYVDGRKVIDRWSVRPPSEESVAADLDLTEGEHPVRVEFFHSAGRARLMLAVQPLGPGSTTSPASRPAPTSAPSGS